MRTIATKKRQSCPLGPLGPLGLRGYWDDKYRKGGHIYGHSPSACALLAYNQLTQFPGIKDKIIMEIGCGTGRNCRFFRERLNAIVVGIDISQKSICLAQKDNNPDGEIKYICADANTFRDIHPHIVFSNFWIHLLNTATRKALFNSINNILTPCKNNDSIPGMMICSLLSANDATSPSLNGAMTEIKGKIQTFFTESQIRQEITDAGLRVGDIHEENEYEVIMGKKNKVPTTFHYLTAYHDQ